MGWASSASTSRRASRYAATCSSVVLCGVSCEPDLSVSFVAVGLV